MKRLPLLLLAVGCWSSVGVHATHDWETGGLDKRSTEDEQPPGHPPPYEGQRTWPGKRSAEEGDCLLDCKKDTILSVQACLQKCKITKRADEDEKLSAQDPPPQPWQVNGPGKRSANSCWSDCLERGRPYQYCAVACGCYPPFCDHGKRSADDEKLSAQDQERIKEEQECEQKCLNKYHWCMFPGGLGSLWGNCGIRPVSTCRNKCQVYGPGKRSTEDNPVSTQDGSDWPEGNGPWKRSAEESSCWSDCVNRGGHSANCALACQAVGQGKRSAEEGDCIQDCQKEGYSWNVCLRRCHVTKRSIEDNTVSAQDPPPQPWQVDGPGKRSIEETRGL